MEKEITEQELLACFDSKGDWIIKCFDPHRDQFHEKYSIEHSKQYDLGDEYVERKRVLGKFWDVLFNDDGNLHCGIHHMLPAMIKSNNWGWMSDAVCLYHAEEFSSHTKSNYSTIYYWR